MQPTLFDSEPIANARRTDPATSHEAAESVDVAGSHAIVLTHLRRAFSMTAEQLIDVCRLNKEAISDSRVRGALSELCHSGKVLLLNRQGISKGGNRCALYKVKGA